MKYHPVVYKIRSRLEDNNISYQFFEHEAVRTSEEAQALRPGFSLKQGAKAIILRIKKKAADGQITRPLVMLVMPANTNLDSKRARKMLNSKSISFASKEEAGKATNGVDFGGVPPFGDIFGLEVFVDKALLENEKIIFNCGDRRASIAMKTLDYLNLVDYTLGSFAVSKL